MKSILPFIYFLFSFSMQGIAQGEFKLFKKYKHSDINYLTIKNINSLDHCYTEMLEHFKPVKGQFEVYIFIKEFKGTSIEYMDSKNPDTLVTFHDLILLKTNNKKQIIDAFFYRLEWAEVPSQFMLFRSFSEPITLTDSLVVKRLNFLNEYEIYSNSEFSENDDINEYGQRILKFIELDILKL